jgi:hypothetical protein
LTIFSFSAENWSRPAAEIRELMGLLRRFIRHDLADLHREGVRVRVIGERESLDPEIRRLLDEAEELTKHNEKLVLVVAFNYGARQEIARAARRMAAAVAAGDLAVSAVTADKLASYLDAPICPIRPHHPHQRRAAPLQFPACGRPPTASSYSCRPIGRISTARPSKTRSSNIAGANGASAVSSLRPES